MPQVNALPPLPIDTLKYEERVMYGLSSPDLIPLQTIYCLMEPQFDEHSLYFTYRFLFLDYLISSDRNIPLKSFHSSSASSSCFTVSSCHLRHSHTLCCMSAVSLETESRG